MDVIIVGAGIGGLALARGLLVDGHQVKVLEQAPRRRTGGAAVTIYSNGAAALAGLDATMDGLGGRIDRLELRRSDGQLLSTVDMTVMARRAGHPVATIARDRLIDHLANDVAVSYGRTVVSAVVRDDGVHVTDRAGDQHRADVLVGADGHGSIIRRSLVDAEPAAANGWWTWQGLTPALPAIVAGTTGHCVVGEAGLCGMLPAGDGQLMWWFDVHDSPPAGTSPAAWLRSRFADYSDPVSTLLAQIRDEDLESFAHVLHRIPHAWGTGPTTLLGDAAHAFPPSQAQGANQALEDAWLLRHALRQPDNVTASLRAYELRRAPRVRLISRLAASEWTNRVPNAAARLLGRITPAWAGGLVYASLIRRCSSVLNRDAV